MKVVLFHHLQNKSAASVARDVCNALYRNGIAVWADPCCRKLLSGLPFVCYAPFLEAVPMLPLPLAGTAPFYTAPAMWWGQRRCCSASIPDGLAFWHPWSRIRSAKWHGFRRGTIGFPAECCSRADCYSRTAPVSGNFWR